jgi:hypothetical protein
MAVKETIANTQPTSEYTSKKEAKDKYANLPPMQQTSTKSYDANFNVVLKPAVKIIEIPLFSVSTTIYDSLPIFPEINILPLIGKKDKIKILFNSGIGEFKMDPVIIEPSDNSIFDNIRRSLNLELGEPLPYRSDDPPAKFEIFRITRHPEGYNDFSGNLIQSIDNRIGESYKYSSSNSFIDRIDPNTKYYYTFRAIDIHGNISNPSPVYKIELVDDEGTTYLLLETVEFKKREKTQLTKDMRKLFNIVPRMSQCIVNGNSIADFSTARGISSPAIGFENETLWGKKFKIRLVSKKTGKKMDLNINFQTEMIPEEIK